MLVVGKLSSGYCPQYALLHVALSIRKSAQINVTNYYYYLSVFCVKPELQLIRKVHILPFAFILLSIENH